MTVQEYLLSSDETLTCLSCADDIAGIMRCSDEIGICLSLLLTVPEYVFHVMMTVQVYLLFSDEAEICWP